MQRLRQRRGRANCELAIDELLDRRALGVPGQPCTNAWLLKDLGAALEVNKRGVGVRDPSADVERPRVRGRPARKNLGVRLLGRARCRQVGVVGGQKCEKWMPSPVLCSRGSSSSPRLFVSDWRQAAGLLVAARAVHTAHPVGALPLTSLP